MNISRCPFDLFVDDVPFNDAINKAFVLSLFIFALDAASYNPRTLNRPVGSEFSFSQTSVHHRHIDWGLLLCGVRHFVKLGDQYPELCCIFGCYRPLVQL